MNIGYIYKAVDCPPSSCSSVHVYQVVNGLISRGCKMYTLQNYLHPKFHKVPRRHLFQFINKIDLLYIRVSGNIFWDFFSILKIFKKQKLPVVWEFNSTANGVGKSRFFLSVEKRWKIAAKTVDAAICVSKEVADYVKNVIKIKEVCIIPNGSDPDLFSSDKKGKGIFPSPDDCINVLWLGSGRHKWHGLNIISEVAKKFEKINKKVKFILITQKDYVRIESDNIIIIDQVPYLSVAQYIASADICLCLYDDMFYKKNFPDIGFFGSSLKLFDYMACAKPTIASSLGQIKEVIRDGENGFLTDNSVEDIIKKIALLVNDRKKSDDMGKAARTDVLDYYNWDRVCRQTVDVFNSILSKKRNY